MKCVVQMHGLTEERTHNRIHFSLQRSTEVLPETCSAFHRPGTAPSPSWAGSRDSLWLTPQSAPGSYYSQHSGNHNQWITLLPNRKSVSSYSITPSPQEQQPPTERLYLGSSWLKDRESLCIHLFLFTGSFTGQELALCRAQRLPCGWLLAARAQTGTVFLGLFSPATAPVAPSSHESCLWPRMWRPGESKTARARPPPHLQADVTGSPRASLSQGEGGVEGSHSSSREQEVGLEASLGHSPVHASLISTSEVFSVSFTDKAEAKQLV